ncbi:nucleoside-diphosphate-sugar epimerase [Flavimobilis soli]|uniref:Nucleoside-diphosphate-sugar epimerase n=1 Tax=Flavimobilis soli TaxID=442709 RepID=A0A2A9EGZ5_9MICO|nr:NAD(P)-dependent oxidoreductase [Flavimobilis soli]PFG37500.1 nucleoside-diphosphate-sugar epimerase [Flavimobilis soli]
MKVLVTGDRGYLGSVLVPMLRRAGHDVLGVDSGWRDVPPAKRSPYPYEQRDGDVRDLSADDLADVGAVVHLAGMAATPEDDWAASVVQTQLVDMARAVATAAAGAGVERLVMVSSRDVYRGRPATTTTGAPLLDRSSPSASARISAEDAFRLAASPTAGVAVLRLATLYGASPRLRLDDELNRAVVSALVDGAVAIDHDGSRLRAFLHVKDACRTIMHALVRLGQTSTGSDTIDVGRLEDVLTLRDALELVSIITGAPVTFGAALDPGDVVPADLGRLSQVWPGLELRWTLAHGIRDLCRDLTTSRVDAQWVQRVEAARAVHEDDIGAAAAVRAAVRIPRAATGLRHHRG